jgi:hypothetical protein
MNCFVCLFAALCRMRTFTGRHVTDPDTDVTGGSFKILPLDHENKLKSQQDESYRKLKAGISVVCARFVVDGRMACPRVHLSKV